MYCECCGKKIIRKSNRQKYCKECAYLIDKLKKKLRMRRKRSLGTSNLWSHRCKDFQREYFLIQCELKRLGLR